MRIQRETILEKLQEDLKTKVKNNIFFYEFKFVFFKEDELNRIRVALDETNYHRQQQEVLSSKNQKHTTDIHRINHSMYDRVKSAPHVGGIYRKVKMIFYFVFKINKFIFVYPIGSIHSTTKYSF